MNVIIYILNITISLLLWLKIVEMIYHSRKYYENAIIPKEDFPITNVFLKIPFVKATTILFRYKLLILFLILLQLIFPGKHWTSAVIAITLFCALWIQVLRILLDQIKYGSFIYFSGNSLSTPWNSKFLRKTHILNNNLNAFIYIFLGQCIYVILGYSCLFNTLHIFSNETAFKSTFENDSLNVFDFIYYSTVTFATVGYGDIIPSKNEISRLLVTTEIIMSVVIVILFIASVSLTFSRNDKNSNP
jgi:hypothetical protein